VDSVDNSEHCTDAKASLHRRTILKLIAGAPLVATFGLLASPLLRYLKPTMKVGNFFQTADLPKAEQSVRFQRADFPEFWTCIPFRLPMRYMVFNPEGHEIRETPGFILRTAKNEIVAYSRICPNCRHSQMLNFRMDAAELDCIPQSKTPVLYCPCACDLSTFDLSNNGRMLGRSVSRPLSRIDVAFDGEYYTLTGVEQNGIV
jgi:hypothetical protein